MLQVIWRIPIKLPGLGLDDGIPIYGFGMMLFLAFLVCTWLGGRLGQREGITKEQVQDLAIWLFIGGLLGARITFLIHRPPASGKVLDFIKEIPRIWDGGIVLYGALLGGALSYALAYYLVFRKQGLSTLRLADVVAPTIAVGLCLGRLGCFLNGCCFGQVACVECAVVSAHFPLSAPAREALVDGGAQTTAGFLLYPGVGMPDQPAGARVALVDPGSAAHAAGLRKDDLITAVNGEAVSDAGKVSDVFYRWKRGESKLVLTVRRQGGEEEELAFVPRTVGLYPTQVYEVVSMALLFVVLLAYFPLRHYPGQVMAVFMMGYAVHRYLNEVLRGDPRPEDFERYSSVIVFVAGAGLWVWLWQKSRREAPPSVPTSVPLPVTQAPSENVATTPS